MSVGTKTKRYLSTRKVLERYGRTRTWLELKIRNDARFPRPYTFGSDRRSWLESELEKYERECVVQS
jgi:predicted DNA-binding transcriptional regulator AlpA